MNQFVIGIVVGLVVMYLCMEMAKKCWISSDGYEVMRKVIVSLGRGVGRWRTAAEQDQNLLVAVLHSNYAAGYLWALLDIATPQQIEDVLGIDYQAVRAAIVETQDKTTMKLAKMCPTYAPPQTVLTKIAREG